MLCPNWGCRAFAGKNGTYDNGVMTSFTLPLHLDIVPAASKAAVQKNLLDMVATTYKDHNMCGIIGMKFLFEQLAAMGREDTALAVLEGTSYPSIGFMVRLRQRLGQNSTPFCLQTFKNRAFTY